MCPVLGKDHMIIVNESQTLSAVIKFIRKKLLVALGVCSELCDTAGGGHLAPTKPWLYLQGMCGSEAQRGLCWWGLTVNWALG